MPKILIVEDNEMNRDMLSRRLERRGFDVVMAVDRGEGVAMVRSEMPDLVLMDMSLPVMNGWEATRAVRADASTAHLPVIALTARSMPGEPRERDGGRPQRLRHQAGRPASTARQDGVVRGRAAGVTPEEASELRHELRTPVNHLMGYAELLLEKTMRAKPMQRRSRQCVLVPVTCSNWCQDCSATARTAATEHRSGRERRRSPLRWIGWRSWSR